VDLLAFFPLNKKALSNIGKQVCKSHGKSGEIDGKEFSK
jgi:hypothetical protein